MTTTDSRPISTARTASPDGVAQVIATALRSVFGGDLPVHLTAWDGSTAGPVDAPRVSLNSANALRRLIWHPGELGASQAYVTGEIDVEGDLGEVTEEGQLGRADRALGLEPGQRAPHHPEDLETLEGRAVHLRDRVGERVSRAEELAEAAGAASVAGDGQVAGAGETEHGVD